MTKFIANDTLGATIATGAVAGAAGGLAEVAWVGVYVAMTGGDASIIARGVTTAAGVDALFPEAAAAAGIGVHMVLSLALGVVLGLAWRYVSGAHTRLGPRVFALAALFTV